jgi:hypothetical protein
MKKLIYSSIIIIAIIAGCSKEYELKKSIFIADPDFSELPAYTEWGYNTFGAFYDRQLFLYSEQEIPGKVICTGGTTTFVLKGQKNSYGYFYWDDANEMSVYFNIPGSQPSNYSDLISLNGTNLDLTKAENKVIIFMDGETIEPQILEGELEFKKSQQLFVDKQQIEVILSGVFSFKALIGGDPVSVSEGRFDIGIGSDNFFKY